MKHSINRKKKKERRKKEEFGQFSEYYIHLSTKMGICPFRQNFPAKCPLSKTI